MKQQDEIIKDFYLSSRSKFLAEIAVFFTGIEPFAKLKTAFYEVPVLKYGLILSNSMAKAIDETISSHILVPPLCRVRFLVLQKAH